MCTVTWHLAGDGFELFCNRDEKKSRAFASPPLQQNYGGVTFLSPIDSDSGGTWIAVNESGVALALLNGVPLRPGTTYSSRGFIIPRLIDTAAAADAIRRAETLGLQQFPPFTLLGIDRIGTVATATWDGRVLKIADGDSVQQPLASSSFDSESVVTMRFRDFRRLGGTMDPERAILERFHRSHANGPSAYSACMHRPDAQTVSFSRIIVNAEGIVFHYTPASPCSAEPSFVSTLSVRRALCISSY